MRDQSLADRLRGASEETREVIWSRRTSQDSKMLWEIPCPERWELLPASERKMRSQCCAAVCWLGEILLWKLAKSQGVIATAKICGQCKKPLHGLKIMSNVPEFTADLHREILADVERALSLGVEVQPDGSWALSGRPRKYKIGGVAREVLADIVKASNANQPEQPEF